MKTVFDALVENGILNKTPPKVNSGFVNKASISVAPPRVNSVKDSVNRGLYAHIPFPPTFMRSKEPQQWHK